MKKTLLLVSLLSSFSAIGSGLQSYHFSAKTSLNYEVVSQFSGAFTPNDNFITSNTNIDGVKTKLTYDYGHLSQSKNGMSKENLIMHVTDKNVFSINADFSGCGEFTYSSKSIPLDEKITLTSELDCTFELSLTEIK
jgi:hypothetical protein